MQNYVIKLKCREGLKPLFQCNKPEKCSFLAYTKFMDSVECYKQEF